MLAGLYLAYAVSRIFADDALAPAVDRARALLQLEHLAGLDVEAAVSGWFVDNPLAGLLASYHYATAHYVVTAVVLVWLFRRHRPVYARARTALVAATVLALAAYLLLPTAPPRLMAGWTDVLALHADSGWWGEAASAPQGLGWMTNQLAAFPSMHAGWALWVALAVSATTASRAARTLAWSHAGLTAFVVVGTGNHWVLDVVAGWAVVAVVWRLGLGTVPRRSVGTAVVLSEGTQDLLHGPLGPQMGDRNPIGHLLHAGPEHPRGTADL
nr:phosphatase PAP2 family protein [Nocardioides gansuensis]